MVKEYLGWLRQYEDVVGRDSVTFSLDRTATATETAGGGLAIGMPPFVVNLSGQAQATAGTTEKRTQNALTVGEVVEILRYGMDVLACWGRSLMIILRSITCRRCLWPGPASCGVPAGPRSLPAMRRLRRAGRATWW